MSVDYTPLVILGGGSLLALAAPRLLLGLWAFVGCRLRKPHPRRTPPQCAGGDGPCGD